MKDFTLKLKAPPGVTKEQCEQMTAGIALAFDGIAPELMLTVLLTAMVQLSKELGIEQERLMPVVLLEGFRVYGYAVKPDTGNQEPAPELRAHGRALRPRVRRVPR